MLESLWLMARCFSLASGCSNSFSGLLDQINCLECLTNNQQALQMYRWKLWKESQSKKACCRIMRCIRAGSLLTAGFRLRWGNREAEEAVALHVHCPPGGISAKGEKNTDWHETRLVIRWKGIMRICNEKRFPSFIAHADQPVAAVASLALLWSSCI